MTDLRLNAEATLRDAKKSDVFLPFEMIKPEYEIQELRGFKQKHPFSSMAGERNSIYEKGPLKIAPVLGKFKQSTMKKVRLSD